MENSSQKDSIHKNEEVLYDTLYKASVNLFSKYNPCEIKDGTCWRTRNFSKKVDNFCCNGCEYVSEKGCTVEAVGCKLWLCHYTNKNKNIPAAFFSVLNILRLVTKRHGFYGIRFSKEDIFNFLRS